VSNYGPGAPEPEGRFERTCKACKVTFRTDKPRQRYCSNRCKRQAQNKRHYCKHRQEIVRRVRRNQKRR